MAAGFCQSARANANDRAYLLALGAVAFKDSQFKTAGLEPPPELLWLLGAEGMQNYEQLAVFERGTFIAGFSRRRHIPAATRRSVSLVQCRRIRKKADRLRTGTTMR